MISPIGDAWTVRRDAVVLQAEPDLIGTQEGQAHQLLDRHRLLPEYQSVGGDRLLNGRTLLDALAGVEWESQQTYHDFTGKGFAAVDSVASSAGGNRAVARDLAFRSLPGDGRIGTGVRVNSPPSLHFALHFDRECVLISVMLYH
ncbi:MAG: hypothetical protein AB4352_12650 [Hormoscilla sp.]